MMLVTGASGFVGKALCAELSKRNILVAPVKRVDDGFGGVFVGEIDECTDWSEALRQCDTVVHLAARMHVKNDGAYDPLNEYRRTNVQGTLNLARQAAKAAVRRLVFISSVKVNGEHTEKGRCFTPNDPPAPQDPYGISKMEAEQGLCKISTETGMEVVIIRPPLVYGPGVKANFAALMWAVRRGWPLPLGAVQNKRSMVALGNLIDFIITCINHPAAANHIFLVSDGQDLSTPELLGSMAQAAGMPVRLLPVPVFLLRLAGRMLGKVDAIDRLCGNLQIDNSKARNLLDWVPPFSVEQGMREIIS